MIVQSELTQPVHSETQEGNNLEREKQTNRESNSVVILGGNLVQVVDQGSRFCAPAKLDLNLNAGEDDIEEGFHSLNKEHLSGNGDHYKENISQDTQKIELVQKMIDTD